MGKQTSYYRLRWFLPALLLMASTARAKQKLEVEPTPGWRVDSPPPHPNIVVAFRHRSGARVVVAIEQIRIGSSLRAFVDGNIQALKKMGFEVGKPLSREVGARPALEVRPKHPKKPDLAQAQVYMISRDKGFVVTLAGSPRLVERLGSSFDELLEAIPVDLEKEKGTEAPEQGGAPE